MGVQDVNRVAPFEPSKAFKKLSTIGVTFGWDRWVVSAAMSLRQWESGIVSPAVGFLLGAGLAASKYCRIRVSSLGLFAVRVTFAFFATYSAAT